MIEKKSNEMINRLNKTKQELDPNFRELREERDRKERLSERKKEQEIVNNILRAIFIYNGTKLPAEGGKSKLFSEKST